VTVLFTELNKSIDLFAADLTVEVYGIRRLEGGVTSSLPRRFTNRYIFEGLEPGT
jgi:hypothetical protein